jgi:hypothetical protein
MRAVRRTMLRVLIPSALAALAAVASLALSRAPDSRWEEKLRRLDPVRPMDYLELGEEVADEAQTDAEQRLARQLFGLAGALDPQRLGRSAMLALAQFAPTDEARARALAAAELVGGRGSVVRRTIAEPAQLEAFARALSYHRRGEGRRALNALKQENADALLERVGEALGGGAEAFRNDCRTMKAADAVVTDEDIVSSGLYVELALRAGELRGAGLDLFLEGDAPLVEIDLADPEGTWGVDPRRPWWRNGSWAGNG